MINLSSDLKSFSGPLFNVEKVEDVPESMRGGTLYLVFAGNYRWLAGLKCPCGCDAAIYLSLNRGAKPRWRVSLNADGVPSVFPSVWRTVGCGSHFWLRKGRIAWVPFNYVQT